ncbi:MAG: PD40 domain-containing protein [Candidatus Eisenbacteria bacterium]|nr:PD40 domain-containing protein [Candidatus Eisenbacteria bacterium]
MAEAPAPEYDRPRPFDLAGWSVQPQLNRISRGGNTHQVEPRIMQVLVILAGRAGEIVTRDELLDAVWGETIVCEDALTRAVSDLRGLLGDDPRSPKMIETIRKRGYRLIAPVRFAEAGAGRSALRPGRSRSFTLRLLIPAGALVAVFIAALLWLRRPSEGPATAPTLSGMPFTSFRGDEIHPALSPDGNLVAFAWTGEEEAGDFDIYVKQANTETPLRLTDHPSQEYFPVWSPDGSAVAFYRSGDRGGIYTVPAIGGPARRVASVRGIRGFDWSPDGTQFALSVKDSLADIYRIRLYSLENAGERWITSPSPGQGGDRDPRFSPDGRSLSFVRSDAALRDDLWLVPSDGGDERPITRSQHRIAGQDWRADGRRIVFAAAPTTEYNLWSLSVSDGRLTWLPTRGGSPLRPSLASRGRGLVFEELAMDLNVWRLDLAGGGDEENGPLIASTREDCCARFSPDGERLLFLSSRSGNREIWVCRRDGSDPRQITHFEGTWISGADWSPEGGRIGFTAFPEGYSAVYLVDPEGGAPRRLTEGRRHEEFCRWSADGRWLYFYTHRDDSWEIKHVAAKNGRVEPVLVPGCRVLHASTDGECFYYYRPPENGIWRHSLAGDGPDECVVPADRTASWSGERVADRGVYATLREGERTLLVFLDFASGETDTLVSFAEPAGSGLDVSPDGREALVDRVERSARDLILVPDFF